MRESSGAGPPRVRSSPTAKPLWQRLASRSAALFGVRFYTMLYGEKSLLGELEWIEPRIPLDVRPATTEDLEHLSELLMPEELELARRARDSGSECLIAWHDGAASGYSWLNRRVIVMVGDRLIDLPPGGAYTFNSFVWPEYRGRRVFQALTSVVYRRLKADGFEFCCNLVDRNNAGSIGARAKFGVTYQPAPILKLPGLAPRILGRRPSMGITQRQRSRAPVSSSSESSESPE